MKLEKDFLSSIASFMCGGSIFSEPLISAIVRASFRQLAAARGENPNFSAEFVKIVWLSGLILQNSAVSSGVRCAFFLPWRFLCVRTAFAISRRSSFVEMLFWISVFSELLSISFFTGILMSIRSSRGAESFFQYISIERALHRQSFVSEPKFPHGHGFVAMSSWNSAGKTVERPALEIVIFPDSSGTLSI